MKRDTMIKEKLIGLIGEKLGDFVELTMPHEIFTEFSMQVRDGVPTTVVFKDAQTGDLYTPEDLVCMTYFSAEDMMS